MSEPTPSSVSDHPTFERLKAQFPNQGLAVTTYAGDTTILVPKEKLHEVMTFLRNDADSDYDFLSDVFGIDYLNYPKATARFAVNYNLVSTTHNRRLAVKVLLNPTLDTHGIEDDPALHVDSVCDLWPGAEWNERETYDMFGVHFDQHPDHRRILTWEDFPAHPLRKDYPLTGRGERERFNPIDRTSA